MRANLRHLLPAWPRAVVEIHQNPGSAPQTALAASSHIQPPAQVGCGLPPGRGALPPGYFGGAAAAEHFAYVGLDSRLLVIELADPASPRLVGWSEPIDAPLIQSVQVKDGRAYLGTYCGLRIMDLTAASRTDAPAPGNFDAPRFVAKGRVAVLGLVTTKFPDLERADDLKRRIEEASRFLDRSQLAVGPNVASPPASGATCCRKPTDGASSTSSARWQRKCGDSPRLVSLSNHRPSTGSG